MDIKETVLNLIKESPSGTFNIQKICKTLGMQKTSDFIKINKVLSSLENDLVISRNHQNNYILLEDANQYKGVVKIFNIRRIFVEVEDGSRYEVSKDDLNGALHLDEVLFEINPKSNNIRIVRIIKRYREFVIGTFHISKNKRIFFDADDSHVVDRLRVLNLRDFKIIDGLKAKARIKKVNEYIEVTIEEIIGHENDPHVDVSAILLANSIPLTFDSEVIKQANQISQIVDINDYPNRIDETSRLTITIDGDDSKDFDDAISIDKIEEGYRLWVHIADVSHYVKENTKLDKEAYNRGTSTYVCDRVVPMLPQVISNGICSLVPNENRLALTCQMDINHKGDITDYKIYESVIKSDYRMTYSNVNKMIHHDAEVLKEYQSLTLMVETMNELSSIIRTRRFNDGAIDFEKDEAKLVLDNNGKVIDIVLRERDVAEKLIEDFMIMANICVARHSKWLDIPSVYRVHENPKTQELEQFSNIAYLFNYQFKGQLNKISSKDLQKCLDHFKDADEYLIIKTLLLRSMSKARYEEKCLGHYGLGLSEYTHFTSPIRRYPDLIVHRMLKKYSLTGEYPVKDFDKDLKLVKAIAINSSLAERRSVDAERSVNDMKMAEYMEDHVGDIYDGVITSVLGFGFFVELPNTIEGLVHINTLPQYFNYDEEHLTLISEDNKINYQIGQKIKIKVVGASKDTGQIDFEVFHKKVKRQAWI